MNTHSYEDLGDELFQMLCQALLVREFANVQCYPVGMPDGGRDAVAVDSAFKGSIVFQVKFNREPAKLNDPVAWICKTIDGEKEKVERLAARGAQQFVLMTNVQGSSHLDAGQMDRVQEYMNSHLPIPAICWWRGDIDRRLENAYDLKLRYPAVLKGADIVRLLWELATKGDEEGRRQSALSAYLAYHYREDSTVRFKQVELVSKSLLDLYIDVPAIITRAAKKDNGRARVMFRHALRRSIQEQPASAHRGGNARREMIQTSDGSFVVRAATGGFGPAPIGGADLLTDPDFIFHFPCVVLEGAPGQGKSTLTQYLAQLQRARILNKKYESERYPAQHRRAPLAIPFRIELRDLATWMKGIDPWHPDSQDSVRHEKPRSLEGALAAHVERYSGGLTFDVADLHRILQNTPTVLLLDALDEVADPEDRATVVSAVCETLARFEGNLITPQVIVTSRPTAIAGSPTFPIESFLHTALAPIEESLALSYAEKWARARRLDESDRQRLPRTLRVKMRAPHIAQLAKNTMQLSILLSLVQRRGSSLPDKRTELYNAYFDIFLDRESEKSAVVRDNRDLLFDIHRFLGFHLHGIAEQKKTSGRIGHERLKWLLRDYLTNERQPYDLIDSLLAGMVERFGALVSRVQGQYEFEVQPLQEYFAARHLNDTAPPSPTGREKPGTKADRFDGIAPNPYWFNVTRFLAGCFNKGELADLADRICDLVNDPSQRGRPFARSLAVALLQDWVFSQSPRATRRVVVAVFDEIGLSWAAADYLDGTRSNTGDALVLPPGGGAEHLAEICWDRILQAELTERIQSICRLLRLNADLESLVEKWYAEFLTRSAEDREKWLTIGAWLGVPLGLDRDRRLALASERSVTWRPLVPSFLIQARAQTDDLPEKVAAETFEDWLKYPNIFANGLAPVAMDSISYLAAWSTNPSTWLDGLHGFSYGSADYFKARLEALSKSASNSALTSIYEVAKLAVDLLGPKIHNSLAPWVSIVTALEERFGRNWVSLELSVIAASIRNSAERGRGGEKLFDPAAPTPTRIRYARRLSGDPTWWREQRRFAADEYDIGMWCVAAAMWTTSGCFLSLAETFDDSIKSLSPDTGALVLTSIERLRGRLIVESKSVDLDNVNLGLSAETLTVVAYHFQQKGYLASRLLDRMESAMVASLCLEWLISSQSESIPPVKLMEYVRKAQVAGGSLSYSADIKGSASRRYDIARLVLDDSWDVPNSLVANATRIVLRKKAKYPPVLEVAATQQWFEKEEDDDFDSIGNGLRRRR